jgi:hypothetical protein
VKGAGYKPNNSGEGRGVTNRVHGLTAADHPFWAWIESKGWKRIEALGEWEFRRYKKGSEIAIFHLRANGNLTSAGHAERLMRYYHNETRKP